MDSLDRRFWRWLVGLQFAEIPQAMAPVAFAIATLSASQRFNVGAAMVSAMTMAQVVFALPLSRFGRRFEPTAYLRVVLLARAAAFTAVTVASMTTDSAYLLVGLAALAGCSNGAVFGSFRTLLTGIVPSPRLPRALALSATANELVFVLGPVLAAVLGSGSATLPLAVMSVCAVLPAVLLAPRSESDPAPRVRRAPGRTVSSALLVWLVAYLATAASVGTVEVGAVSLALHFGFSTAAAAIFPLALCIASVAGGIALTIFGRAPGHRTVLVLLSVMVAGSLLIGSAGQVGPVIAGCALMGLCLAPLETHYSLAAEAVLRPDQHAEGFAVLRSAQGLGIILTSSLLTFLGVQTVALSCAAATFVGLITVAASRQRIADRVALVAETSCEALV